MTQPAPDLFGYRRHWAHKFGPAPFLPMSREEMERLEPEDAALNRHFFGEGEAFRTEYCQDHLPVREQDRAVGHAVRAMYLYCAMADVAGETGVRERMVSVSGVPREVIRDSSGVRWVLGDDRSVLQDQGFNRTFFPQLPLDQQGQARELCVHD